MADGIKEIIDSLERQKSAIENALSALREIQENGSVSAPSSPSRGRAAAKRKGGMTPEGRKRLAEAMKRRWAVKRAASQVKRAKRVPRKKAAA
jgi:hypothetical protein